MVEILFYVFIGALIGWHLPEPSWVNAFKEKLTEMFNEK